MGHLFDLMQQDHGVYLLETEEQDIHWAVEKDKAALAEVLSKESHEVDMLAEGMVDERKHKVL